MTETSGVMRYNGRLAYIGVENVTIFGYAIACDQFALVYSKYRLPHVTQAENS